MSVKDRFKQKVERLLPKNKFTRGVSVLVGGTAGAQVLMVLAAPLLTRLYTPADFGLLAVYISLLSLFTVNASLRYELAIPLPKDDQTAANTVALCITLVVIVSGLSGLVIVFAGEKIANFLHVPILNNYFWLLPIGVLLLGFYQVFNSWAIRTKEFSAIAVTRISQALAVCAIQVGVFKVGGIALLIGHVGGQSVGSLSLAKSAFAHTAFKGVTRIGIKASAVRYRRFPIYSTWSSFFNTAGAQLPSLMLAAFFGANAAGLYVLANRVLAMPMSVIGTAIGNVFFSSAAEAYRAGKLGSLVVSVQQKLAQISMPPTLILIIAGPELFALFFGEQWRQAGDFARWMAPWLYLSFITTPLTTLYDVMEKQKQEMFFQSGLLMARVTAILLGVWQDSLIASVILFSMASAIFCLAFLVWVAINTSNTLSSILQPTMSALLQCFPLMLPLAFTLYFDSGGMLWLLVLSLTCVGLIGRYWRIFHGAR